MPSAGQSITNRSGIGSFGACLVFGIGAYFLVVIAAYHTQPAIIFGAGGLAASPPSGLPIESVAIPTIDGLRLNGWWLQAPGAQRTVLFFQGNRRRACDHGQRIKTMVAMGVNALFFDYRGFGQTEGRIRREEDLYRDGLAAWNFLIRERRIPAGEIVLWGRSMGGAIAVEIAYRKPAGALVLESTFFALQDMARRHYRWLPTRYLLKFHFRSGEKMPQIHSPVIVIHSPEDGYVPFDQGRRLFMAAAGPKVLMTTTGHHLELFDRDTIQREQFIHHLNTMMDVGQSVRLP
jgi:hypothetical protein